MDQFIKLISGLSLKQKSYIVLAALLTVGGLVGFTHWKHESDFRPLYTAMAPEDAAGVVQKLRETGVEYRLSENGTAVMVAPDKLAESRLALAAAGLPKTGRIGFELFDKSNFGATEFVEHINYQRALEGELERSVMSLAEVEQARVHLTLSKESVFLDQQQPAKASVMVKLRPGAHISQQNVLAVTHLVASAVEGLAPDAVTLVDMDGNLLSRLKKASADGAETGAESLEVRQQIEHGLVTKISETLEPLLGAGGFRAGASVDCDLTSGDQQEETLDPNHSVMLSSQKTEDSSERSPLTGIPGTASNMPSSPAAPKTGNAVSRRTENITYQTSRIVRHTHIPEGVIRRMSLAILVGQKVSWEGDGNAKRRVLVPPSPETLKTIHDVVAGVTGLSAERGDQLIVETLPFASEMNSEPPAPVVIPKPPVNTDPPWLQFANKYRSFWLPAAVGVVLLVIALIAVLKMLRSRKSRATLQVADELESPAAIPELSPAATAAAAEGTALAAVAGMLGPGNDHIELSDRVRDFAKREPVAAVNVLRMWLTEKREVESQT